MWSRRVEGHHPGRRRAALAVLVAAALIVPTASPARATFSAPVVMGPSPAENSDVAVDASGNATVVWRFHDGSTYRIRARTISATGVRGPVSTLSPVGRDSYLPQVAVDADGDATVVWWSDYLVEGASHRVAQARQISSTGILGPIHTLSTDDDFAYPPQVAVDGGGNATVVWWKQRYDGRLRYVVQARTISAAGTVGPIQDVSNLSRHVFSGAEVGVDADGDATVVWEPFNGSSTSVQTRTLFADGTLGPVLRLKGGLSHIAAPELAVAPDGAATVVWKVYDNPSTGGFRIQGRTLSAEHVLGPVHNLSVPGLSASDHQVAVDQDGDATVVWSLLIGPDERIQSRTFSAAGAPGPTLTLSAAGQDAELPRVAVDGDGDAVVAWNTHGGPTPIVEARAVSAVGPGRVQTLSTNGTRPAVGISPTGAATITWTGLASGPRILASRGP